MKPHFAFYEKVVVRTEAPNKKAINGELGAVMGRVQTDSGDWCYSVHIYSTSDNWYIYEHELRPTGEFDRRETFYSGESVRVAVDENGAGYIVDER